MTPRRDGAAHRTPEEKRQDVTFTLASTDLEFDAWLSQNPSEDELRSAYLHLETRRADLCTTGHIDSFRRDRYELDTRCVRRLVRIKQALAETWATSGQITTFPAATQLV